MPIKIEDVQGQIVSGVITAVVLAAGGLLWNWASGGGLIHALNGVTQEDLQQGKGDAHFVAPTSAALPAGAILAFDLENGCPKELGWSEFSPAVSRAIIGAFAGAKEKVPTVDKHGAQLSKRTLEEQGGEEQHTLTDLEMPKHQHETVIAEDESKVEFGVGPSVRATIGNGSTVDFPTTFVGGVHTGALTSKVGGGGPHDIMPPFIALYYCRKDK